MGQGEVNPRELEEEFEEKRVLYQTSLQPYYRQCKKMEVVILMAIRTYNDSLRKNKDRFRRPNNVQFKFVNSG